jgi:hypothetical protein
MSEPRRRWSGSTKIIYSGDGSITRLCAIVGAKKAASMAFDEPTITTLGPGKKDRTPITEVSGPLIVGARRCSTTLTETIRSSPQQASSARRAYLDNNFARNVLLQRSIRQCWEAQHKSRPRRYSARHKMACRVALGSPASPRFGNPTHTVSANNAASPRRLISFCDFLMLGQLTDLT